MAPVPGHPTGEDPRSQLKSQLEGRIPWLMYTHLLCVFPHSLPERTHAHACTHTRVLSRPLSRPPCLGCSCADHILGSSCCPTPPAATVQGLLLEVEARAELGGAITHRWEDVGTVGSLLTISPRRPH